MSPVCNLEARVWHPPNHCIIFLIVYEVGTYRDIQSHVGRVTESPHVLRGIQARDLTIGGGYANNQRPDGLILKTVVEQCVRVLHLSLLSFQGECVERGAALWARCPGWVWPGEILAKHCWMELFTGR